MRANPRILLGEINHRKQHRVQQAAAKIMTPRARQPKVSTPPLSTFYAWWQRSRHLHTLFALFILLCCLCRVQVNLKGREWGCRPSGRTRVIIVHVSSVRGALCQRARWNGKCVMRPEHWSTYALRPEVIFLVFRSPFAKNTNEDTGISSNRFGQIPRRHQERYAIHAISTFM